MWSTIRSTAIDIKIAVERIDSGSQLTKINNWLYAQTYSGELLEPFNSIQNLNCLRKSPKNLCNIFTVVVTKGSTGKRGHRNGLTFATRDQ